ncbi:TIM barrel protein [Pyrobaculum aerophilum]|uniref:Endonuclease IV n=1 Tax=Pyrobaculum aerophilum TaxID=13773 RepID=A0A371R570_9CREN|nr:deoxyribonuclease IV [Pyrobaculum aerophilum]RFA94496.1 endonuclease IV [Pyrobaculum aerophilum]RFA99218.1 endonuclease IV [Pyrobaculum aerophilum]
MAKVYLGPAGIPQFVVKAKSTLDAVKVVRELGLNAMEVEFVQGVRMSRELAKQVGKAAQDYQVKLSVHAPYFINLCSEEADKVEKSRQRLVDSLDRAYYMGAWVVVVHAAYYGKLGPERCYEKVKEELEKAYKESGIGSGVYIGVEITARTNQFGSVEEAFRLGKELPFVVPVIDWGHLYARNNGTINYGEILDLWAREFGNAHMHTHFTSVRYRNGKFVDEHEPIERNMPPFEPLARELKNRDITITLICESPLLEKDALLMKEILEQVGVNLA